MKSYTLCKVDDRKTYKQGFFGWFIFHNPSRFKCIFIKALVVSNKLWKQFGGVAVILAVNETFGCLVYVNLACNGIECRLHKRVHGGSSFTQVIHWNRSNAVLFDIDLYIEGLVTERNCGSIDTGNVACTLSRTGGWGRRFFAESFFPVPNIIRNTTSRRIARARKTVV